MMHKFKQGTILSIAGLLMAVSFLSSAFGDDTNDSTSIPQSVAGDLSDLSSKAAQLQSALGKEGQTAKSNSAMAMKGSDSKKESAKMDMADKDDMSKMSTMKKDAMADMKKMDGKDMKAMSKKKMGEMADKDMKSMDMKKMGPKKMARMKAMKKKRMNMMGRMPESAGMSVPSSLPGFPGASHIYHIGGTGFFLDHPEHITLTVEQQSMLGKIKEKALLADSTLEREIEEAEQALWVLTGSDSPDIKQIESKIREIEKLKSDRRLAFIRDVGKAAAGLTDEQRKTLVGEYSPE